MPVYADFELHLSRIDGDIYSVQVHIRGDTIRTPQAGRFCYDEALRKNLRAKEGSGPDDYGRVLGQALLEKALLDELDHAVAKAETLNKTLRLTIWPDRSAHELQALRWETLRHPRTDLTLASNGRILFSRFLVSASGRTVRLPPRGQIRAVVAVAASSDAETNWGLSSIDPQQEFDTAQAGLIGMSHTFIGGKYSRATRDALLTALRNGADVLYLVAHGGLLASDKIPEIKLPGPHPASIPCLFLERTDGRTLPVTAHDLVADLAQLPTLPRLAIVVSCRSADPESAASLAWLLGEAGVPAVLAMQGDFQMSTARIFLPALLKALQNNEPIDAAVAAGRAVALSAGCIDWWMPALYSRVSDGRIWQAEDQIHRHHFEHWLRRVQPRLNTVQLDRLANALLACPSTNRLPLADLPDFETLCADLHFWDANETAALDSLRAVLHDLDLLPLIPWQGVVELQQILAGVRLRQDDLHHLYGHCRPSAGWIQPVGRDPIDTMARIVRQFAGAFKDRKGSQALIEFVRRLCVDFSEQVAPVANQLRDWETKICKQLGLDLTEPEVASTHVAPTLVVQLTLAPGVVEPDLSRPASVSVIFDAWLITDTAQQLAHREEISLAQAAARFTEVAKFAVASAMVSSDVLPIEFVLPMELLLYGIETWTIKRTQFGQPTPIAHLHPVVVRSLDRLNPSVVTMIKPNWERRWQRRNEVDPRALINPSTANEILALIDQSSRNIHQINAALTSVKRVLLLQTSQPSDADMLSVVGAAIEHGYPIAIIVRTPCAEPAQLAAKLCQVLAAEPSLNMLPALVMAQRQAAGETGDAQHYGNHVTLLWDNPEHIPPLIFYA